jgi:hypothetical protein
MLVLAQKFELVTSPVLDLGTAYEDSSLEGRIIFKNNGDKPMTIGDIRTSCGCTVAQLEKLRYYPGEEGQISVRFNSKGFSGVARKSVTIYVKEGTPANVRVILQANIKSKVEIEPSFVDFQDIKLSDASPIRNIEVKNNMQSSITIAEVKTNLKSLEIKPKKFEVKPGSSQMVEIKLILDKEEKRTGYLIVKIDKPSQMTKRIPVFVKTMQ